MVKIISKSKTNKFKRDDEGKFVKGNHVKSEFKKGNKPWNYGLTKETDPRVKAVSENKERKLKIGKASIERNAVGNAKRGWDEWFERDPSGVRKHLNTIGQGQHPLGSSIEIKVRDLLSKLNIKYFTNVCSIEGSPDIVISNNDNGHPIAIFVDGCYWHCCNICKDWFNENYEDFENSINVRHHDKTITENLKRQGFIVYRIWEHDFKNNMYEEIIKNIIKENNIGEI